MTLTFGSLFAGIGGFDLGFERAGMKCLWQVEIDPFCQKVLAKHWPDIERFTDVKECGKHNLGTVDVICGGFPCQPHSLAGIRRGEKDDRNLWPEYLRIIEELNPEFVVGENVLGIRTTILDQVLFDLENRNYSATSFIIPACALDADHRRERLFIIAHTECVRFDRGNWQPGIQIEKGRMQQSKRFGRGRTGSKDCRKVDGIPSELDRNRVKALGNAIVPQIAEFIGELIIRAHNKRLNEPTNDAENWAVRIINQNIKPIDDDGLVR